MNISDYSMKVKKVVDLLASTDSLVEDDILVFVSGLNKEYC